MRGKLPLSVGVVKIVVNQPEPGSGKVSPDKRNQRAPLCDIVALS